MFSNLRFFFRKLDTIISQAFFCSQSRFTALLKDFLFSILNGVNPVKNFELKKTEKDKVNVTDFKINEENFSQKICSNSNSIPI